MASKLPNTQQLNLKTNKSGREFTQTQTACCYRSAWNDAREIFAHFMFPSTSPLTLFLFNDENISQTTRSGNKTVSFAAVTRVNSPSEHLTLNLSFDAIMIHCCNNSRCHEMFFSRKPFSVIPRVFAPKLSEVEKLIARHFLGAFIALRLL